MANPDYMVGNAPAGASYAAPLVGFQLGQALARLPQDYAEGGQRARSLAMQNAFPQGVPRRADGSPDVDRIADTALRLGGLDYARPLLNFLATPQRGNSAAQDSAGSFNAGDSTAAPGTNPASAASVPSATGPANLGVQANRQPSSPPTSDQPTSNVPFAPTNAGVSPTLAQEPAQQPAIQGGDLAMAQRLQAAAQHLRTSAANLARQNDQTRAWDFAQRADAYEARANEIYDRLGQQLRPGPAQNGARDLAAQGVQQGSSNIALGNPSADPSGYAGIARQARAAGDLADALRRHQPLLDSASLAVGSGDQHDMIWKNLQGSLALDPRLTPQEAFRQTVSSAIRDQVGALGGRGLSEGPDRDRAADFNVISWATQAPTATPASNRLLGEIQMRIAKRWTLPIAEFARTYQQQHGGLDAGFDRFKTEWINEHPLFSREERQDPRRIAPPLAHSRADLKTMGWSEGMPVRAPDPRSPGGFRIVTGINSSATR
jgi:hypothetical protein